MGGYVLVGPNVEILRVVADGLRMFLVSSYMVGYGIYGYSAHPTFKRALELVALQLGKYLKKAVVQYFFGRSFLAYIPADDTIYSRGVTVIYFFLRCFFTGNSLPYQAM